MLESIDTRYFTPLKRVTGVTPAGRGILVDVDGEMLRVEVLRDDILRLKISRGGVFDEEPTFSVSAGLSSAIPAFNVEESEEAVRVRTSRMALTIWREPFRLDAHRADGSAIFESYHNAKGDYWGYATLNDAFLVMRKCRQNDAIFGLGEKSGAFNRKGRDFILWNNDVLDPNSARLYAEGRDRHDPRADETSTEFDPYYASIPFFYHAEHHENRMAGFFLDNGYRAYFDFTPGDHYLLSFGGGQYTEYVFAGPSMREILEGYTWLTGRMSPPPLWALGYHQCRWYNYNQADIEELARQHRQRHIPCDTLWLDIDYMDGFRVFTWNEEAFPDARGMISRLAEQGFRTVTIIDPGVKYEPGYSVFDQAVERDVLCRTESGDTYVGQVWPGKTAFPDFVTEEAREWWGELNAEHVSLGVAGIWNDMNEPATGDIPPHAMRFGKGRYSHARYHNQYALLMAMGTTAGLQRALPDRRTFVLSRAGFAGIQRYAANWMGDNMSRWDHLWLSVPMALGFGVSGQPFVGADIGGFAGSTNPELFLRWMQCGVLTAFCRNHAGSGDLGGEEWAYKAKDQYAWSFGQAIEELCREAISLRYRLMPYIYAGFMRSAETGEPVNKPLVFEFQDDRTVRDIDDEYLFGSDLLVAPIYTQGATARQVYLPEGTWYRWHTGERFEGRRFVTASAPMDHIPLFVRGGAVLPLWPEAPASTMGYHPDAIELHVYVPGADGDYHSALCEDDGLTMAYREGAYYRTGFTLRREGSSLTLWASVTGNGYPEFARNAFHIRFLGNSPVSVRVDGRDMTEQAGLYVVPNRGSDFLLTAELA